MQPSATRARRAARPDERDPTSATPPGLRFVSDVMPGIRRRRSGKAFVYIGTDGKPVRDPDVIRRIKAIVIPPAWTDVWICPDPRGHIQAVGRDAKGRKQYRDHARFREVRDLAKYEHLVRFAQMLPKIRRRVNADLAGRGLTRERVLATVVALLDITHIRVGNEEYARANRSFGLTTFRNKHAKISGTAIRFRFRGKSGIEHEVGVRDRRLARVVRQCQELPGQALFQYLDDEGERRSVESGDVNDYLREITGADITAKDFRTWAGTVLAALALREFEAFDSQAQAKRNVTAAIERVAKRLGNTKAVCRKCYVHPAILESYADGTFALAVKKRTEQTLTRSLHELQSEEAAVLALLQERLKRDAKKRKAA